MTVVYTNANIFQGTKDELLNNAWFLVGDDGRIADLGTTNTPQADQTVDLHGQYVMSGLINAHTHIFMNALTNKLYHITETEGTLQALENLRSALKAGQTYIRDCGCIFDIDIKLQKYRQQHPFVGPNIVPSGRPMSMTGGHGDFVEGENGETTWGHLVDSEDEMRHAVRLNFKEGAQNIKLMSTGGVMSATDRIDDTELTVAEMKTAVEEAHSKHMTVAAHAEGGNGIHNAILAGVDSVEHGSYISDEDIQAMVEHGTYLTPTLIAAWSIPEYGKGKLPQYMLDKASGFLDDYFKHIGRAFKAGVKISFGTDAGCPFDRFADAPKELELMVQAGATNFQALQSAGLGSATLLRINDDYGTLEKGKFADFLVLKDNPLANVAAVQQEDKQVYQHGQRQF